MKPLTYLAVTVLFLWIGCPSFAGADDLLVPSQYSTIQSAIDAAANGDTVIVSPGSYEEFIDFSGKAITVMSSEGPETTVIDAKLATEKVSVVTFQNGEGLDSALLGFRLVNGRGTLVELPQPHDYSDYVGGGILCYGASPTIRNNICESNTTAYGGGIGCAHSAAPLIEDNVILDNRAPFGAGIACVDQSTPTIVDNHVLLNNGAYTGGGFYLWDSSPLIESNLIEANRGGYGAGLALITAAPLIANNVFWKNDGDYGGGIYGGFDSTAQMVNNTFYNNDAPYGEALCSWRSSMSMTNCVVWSTDTNPSAEILIGTTTNPSTFTISHCNIKGGYTGVEVEPGCTLHWGGGMISADPLFAAPDGGDFHYLFNSPCRGSGDSAAAGLPEHDFEGDPRNAYGTVDIGADEFYTHLYHTGDATPGGTVHGKMTGLPGTLPVALIFGSDLLEQPMATPWGDFYLAPPWITILPGSIPSTGILEVSDTLPMSPSLPYDIPMQALVGDMLTNASVIEVR